MTEKASAKRLRVAIAVILAFFGLASALDAAVQTFRKRMPTVALQIDGTEGEALVRQEMQKIVTPEGTVSVQANTALLARQALADEPLNSYALMLLGLVELDREEPQQARDFLRLSERVTRRNEATQILLADYAIRRNDVGLALELYDRVMRTSNEIESILFPSLIKAIKLPALRQALSVYVANDADWLSEFIDYALAQEGSSIDIARLIDSSDGLPASPGYRDLERQLLLNLARDKEFAAISDLTSRGIIKAETDLTGVRPSLANTIPGLADWQLASTSETNALIGAGATAEDAPTIEVRTRDRSMHQLARKFMMLPPGRYRLATTLDLDGMVMAIRVSCDDPAGARTIAVAEGIKQSGRQTLGFTVDCPAQYIDISGQSDRSPLQDSSASIRDLSLVRQGGGGGSS